MQGSRARVVRSDAPDDGVSRVELVSFHYCVLRYAHDPAAGEALNIGVVFYSPQARLLDAEIMQRYRRLSDAFSGFDGEQYKRSVNWFLDSIKGRQAMLEKMTAPDILHLEDLPHDARSVALSIWGDTGMSLQVGPNLVGVTDNPAAELQHLYDRFVADQYDDYRRPKRSDREVWQVYQEALRRENVSVYLQPQTFHVEDFDYKFDHTFKNGAWHVLHPASMDYADKSGMRDRVDKLLGEAQVLERSRVDIGKVYLLLGKPSNPEHLPSYYRAVKLLDEGLAIKHELVEEEEANEFGKRLRAEMEKFGIMRLPTPEPDEAA